MSEAIHSRLVVLGVRWAAALQLFAVAACHGSVQGTAQVNASVSTEDRKWEEAEHDNIPSGTAPPRRSAQEAIPETLPAPPAFLGIAHDLSLTPSTSRSAACRCLAVGFGPPGDAQFAWQVPPSEQGESRMAIAIAADGVPCSSPGYAPLRASIAGVAREGDNVVVTVENVGEGRPVMRGVLAPRPAPGGAIVVRARGSAPYGAPAKGDGRECRLAVP